MSQRLFNAATIGVVLLSGILIFVSVVGSPTTPTGGPPAAPAFPTTSSGLRLGNYRHIVVLYEENHSFDNLFGSWEGADGRPDHPVAQVDASGQPLACLPQDDVNLTSPPLTPSCSLTLPGGKQVQSAFTNEPFPITRYIPASATTCPRSGTWSGSDSGVLNGQGDPGGCTRDLIHSFYQERYMIDGGRMDRYVTGSTALGLSVGYYQTQDLPLYRYLHSAAAPDYAIEDRFFHAAIGGSALNHQWLIAARTPVWPHADASGGPDDQHSVVGPDGYPAATALHPLITGTVDGILTQAATASGACAVRPGGSTPPPGTICGDYAVNTAQPPYQPYKPGTPPEKRVPAQTAPTIGDRLSGRGIDWAWYSGGWDNADGNVGGAGWTNGSGPTCSDPTADRKATYPHCPDADFQYHHQPFNYFANYAPGTEARKAHLRDEAEFLAAARSGNLKPVSFVKPIGRENEHPGYASQPNGDSHLVQILEALENGPQAKDTLVVVTYDEFGGQWDHMSPPVADEWGPGTRIPAVVVFPGLPQRFTVDHTPHDTTSILAEIEHHFGLQPVATRDALATDLSGKRSR